MGADPFFFSCGRHKLFLACCAIKCEVTTLEPLRKLSHRARVLVDHRGVMLADPDNNVIGVNGPMSEPRVVYALALNADGGHLTQRYRPPHPPGETCEFGMDFSAIIPVGIGIASGTLEIFLNVVPPTAADSDWTAGPTQVRSRALYATLSGGVTGTDYMLRWAATDTEGNIWVRFALVLVTTTA